VHVSYELCATLMKAGADLNVIDSIDGTPLEIAISNDSLDGVRSLLSARLQYPDTVKRALCTFGDDGDLPLHRALHARSAEITQVLVDAGVDVNAPNQNGTVPLLIAVGYNDINCARVLLQNKNTTSNLNIALCYATHHGK